MGTDERRGKTEEEMDGQKWQLVVASFKVDVIYKEELIRTEEPSDGATNAQDTLLPRWATDRRKNVCKKKKRGENLW